MAKFCNQCGKPLQDGEICTCTQQKASAPVNMQPVNKTPVNPATQAQNSAAAQSFQTNPSANAQAFQTNQAANQQTFQQNQQAYQPNQQTFQPNQQAYQPNQQAYQANQSANQQAFQPNQNANASQYIQQSSQVVNQVKDQTMNIFSKIIPFFKHPIAETKALVAMDNLSAGLPLIIFHIVVVFLLSILEALMIHVKLGDLSDYVNIPYVKAVILITLIVAIADFALAGILLLTTKSILKADTSFAKILSLVGAKSLIGSCVLVAGMIFFQLSAVLGMFILLLGFILSTLILIIGYCNTVSMSEDTKVYSLFVSNIVILIIDTLCFYIMYKSVMDQFSDYLSYFF